MTKKEFLKKLRRKLNKLKKEECNKYIEYYDEIISDIVESGVSEAEAISRQGSVERIAEDILLSTAPGNLKARDLGGICLVVVSLILLLCTFVSLIFRWQLQISMSTAVDIIGGEDGPTSVFVAGKIGTPWGIYFATAVVVVTTIVYYVRKRAGNLRKLFIVLAAIGVVAVVGLLLTCILKQRENMKLPFGDAFKVGEVTYSQSEEVLLNFVPTENTMPVYYFTEDYIAKYAVESVLSAQLRTLGKLTEVKLTEGNFDAYFPEDAPTEKLRRRNKQAWQLVKEDSCYQLLQQKFLE